VHSKSRLYTAMQRRTSNTRNGHRPGFVALAVLALVYLLGLPATQAQNDAPAAPPAPRGKYNRGALIRFEGPITPMREQFLYRKLDEAQRKGADLVIIEIDSPGGQLIESLNMAHRLRDLDWAHTVAFVPRQALSGAAIMALGCDEIVMNPQAMLGDAGPIFMGEDFLFHHAPEKVRSHLAQEVRGLAEAKGRPPALAEAMVDMNLIVYRVRHKQTGEFRFMADHEISDEDTPDDWEKIAPVPESREDHFLEVSGTRAVEVRLAEGNARDRAELKSRYDVTGDLLIMKPGSVDTAVYILNLPIVTGLLFVIGLIALYVELSAPGISVGGLIAGLCFALFFWSRFLGGTSGWLEIILFLSGVIFLAVELFVLPGFGVAGITGLLLMFAGVVLASQNFVIPSTERQLSTMGNTLLVIVASGVVFAAAAMALSRHLGSIPLLNRLLLAPPSAGADSDVQVVDDDGKPVLASTALYADRLRVHVGDWGTADSPLRPAGKARFGEEYVDVVTDGSFVDKGRQVRVIEISGNRVVVREVEG
jgi:membrane-bound serine protease (ClpP class)